MKSIALVVMTASSYLIAQEEKIPQFDYKFNGVYEAPIEYFTEYYYQPSMHLDNLKIDQKNIRRENEIKLYMMIRLAQMACKEKFGQDYPLSDKSDLYQYLISISDQEFGDTKPLMIKNAIQIMSAHLVKK